MQFQQQFTHEKAFDRVIQPANPAAGAELAFPVPATDIIYPHTITLRFDTAVAAANRQLTIRISLGGSMVMYIPSGYTQTASLTAYYTFSIGLPRAVAALADPLINAPLPYPYALQNTGVISTLTENIQAADQISQVTIWYGNAPVI